MPPPPQDLIGALTALAWITVAVGLVGSVVPVVPGPSLIWIGALIWGWTHGFEGVGAGTLLVLGTLAVLATAADILLAGIGARRTGASWRALLFAGMGSVIGLLVLSVPGALLGALVGVLVEESRRRRGLTRDGFEQSVKVGSGLLAGWLLAIAVQAIVSLVMVAIFALRALT